MFDKFKQTLNRFFGKHPGKPKAKAKVKNNKTNKNKVKEKMATKNTKKAVKSTPATKVASTKVRATTTKSAKAATSRANTPAVMSSSANIATRLQKAGGRFIGIVVQNRKGQQSYNVRFKNFSKGGSYINFTNSRTGNPLKVESSKIVSLSGV